jgi:hypothetical protein
MTGGHDGDPTREGETGASVIDGPTPEEEEHVGEDDLGESSGSEAEEQAEHRRIGFMDENEGLFPEMDADSANAKADCRTCKQRMTEKR